MQKNLFHMVCWLSGALVFAGCASKQSSEKEDPSRPSFRMMGESAKPSESPSDETIGQEVRRRLNLIGTSQTMGVIVEVDDGVVTLRGVAMNQDWVWRACGAASSTPGVKKVNNQILIGGGTQPVY